MINNIELYRYSLIIDNYNLIRSKNKKYIDFLS